MKCRNSAGQMVEAPADLKRVVCSLYDGHIVWSWKSRKRHQVRYGLQVKTFADSILASEEIGHCIHHHCECEGKLDTA